MTNRFKWILSVIVGLICVGFFFLIVRYEDIMKYFSIAISFIGISGVFIFLIKLIIDDFLSVGDFDESCIIYNLFFFIYIRV